VHRLLRWIGGVAAVLILVLLLGAWRLAQGPVQLDFLAPYAEAALARSGIGVDVTVAGLRFGIDRETHHLDLRADNVRLAAAAGTPLASFPETAMSLALGPLLRGRIAPTRLVVEGPVLHLRRDAAGAISVRLGPAEQGASAGGLAALDSFLVPPERDAPWTTLRRIAVRDATVVVDDQRSGVTWRAQRVAAAIERKPDGISGDLSFALPLGRSVPELHASYYYRGASRVIDLDLALDGVHPADLPPLVPEIGQLRQIEAALSATLRSRIDLASGMPEGARLDIAVGQGRLRSDLLPNGGIAIESGEMHASYSPEHRELRLDAFRLDLGGGSELVLDGALAGLTPELIAAVAEARPTASPVKGNFTAALKRVPAARFGELWPAALSPGGRRWVLANVHGGVLDEASLQLAVDLDPAAHTATVLNATGALRYHDVTVSYLKGLEPARKVSGTAVFAGNRLEFTPTGGMLRGLSVGSGGSLLLTDLGDPVEWLTVDLPATGPLRDVLEVIDAKPLGYAHDIGVDPAQVAGHVETQLHFRLPLLDALKLQQIEYAVGARLTGVSVARAALDRDITAGDFALSIERPGARLRGRARFDGIPADLEAEVFFHPANGPKARYRIAAMLDGAARRRLGLDIGAERVTGPIGIDATYAALAGNRAEATALLDLREAALAVPEAGWKKSPGEPGTARIVLDLDNERISRIRRIDAEAPGLGGVLSGRLAADGKQIDRIDIHRLRLGESELAGTLARRSGGGWRADIHAARLDARHLLKKSPTSEETQPAKGASPPLAVNARIGRLILGDDRELRQVSASLLRDGDVWESAQIDAHTPGGGSLWLRLGDGGPEGQRLVFHSDDLGAMLRLLDITGNVVGGQLRIDGHLLQNAGKRVLRAHIDGTDYTVKNSSIAGRVLALPSLTGFASAISGSGLPFSTLRGDVVYSGSLLTISEMLASGESLGITATGWVDTDRDRLQLNGTVAPAYALNSLIGKVPIVGDLLGGGSQGLFAANFRLRGATEDPDISVNPLSALAPGRLRQLFAPLLGYPKPQPEGQPQP
jgi:hypothetical protein